MNGGEILFTLKIDPGTGQADVKGLAQELLKAAGASDAFGKSTDNAANTGKKATTGIRALRAEIMDYKAKADAAGLSTPVGQNFLKLAGEAKLRMTELNESVKNFGAKNVGLNATTEGVRLLTGAFEIANGAGALFGGTQEQIEAASKKAMIAISLLNGVQEISNILRADSSLMEGASALKMAIINALTKEEVVVKTAEIAVTKAAAGAKQLELFETEELIVAKEGDIVATTGAAGATKLFGIALDTALPIIGWVIGAITLATAAWYFFSDGAKEAEETLKRETEANEKAAEAMRKMEDKIQDTIDKRRVLDKEITASTAEKNKREREFLGESLELNKKYLADMAAAYKTESITGGVFTQITKQTKASIEERNNLTKNFIKQQAQLDNGKTESEKLAASQAADEARKKAEEEAKKKLAYNTELRKIEFDNTMAQTQSHEDLMVANAKGNEELVLKAHTEADKIRLADTILYYQAEVNLTKGGTIERLNANKAYSTAVSAASKKLNADELAESEKYRKDLIELNKEYDAMVLANMPEGVKKEIAQIDKRYADLLEKEKFNLISNDAATKALAQKLVDEAGVTKKQDTTKAIAKGDMTATDQAIATNNILLGLRKTGFEEQRILIDENANNEINEAQKLYAAKVALGVATLADQEELAAKLGKIDQDRLDAQRANTKKQIEQVASVINAAFEIANGINAAVNAGIDDQISQQEKRVAAAKGLADRGNAEVYRQEQLRLDKLLKQKEEAADRTAALAQIQMVANAGIAISEAAAEGGGVGSIVTIAVTLAALIAGLASAKSAAGGYAQGGVDIQGAGTGTSDSIATRISRGESVLRANTTAEYKPTILAMHEGRVDAGLLNRFATDPEMQQVFANNAMMVAMPGGLNQAAGGMTKEDFADVVKDIPAPTVIVNTQHWTENGMYNTQEKISRKKAMVLKHARNGK